MSVLAVVFDEPNLEEMEGWSHWIADSLEQDIKIFYVGSTPIKESGSKINYLNIENTFPVIRLAVGYRIVLFSYHNTQ